jgi:hypothetical protein
MENFFPGVNEAFAELISPTFSSIDEKSKEPGKCAANIYFKNNYSRKLFQIPRIIAYLSCNS